MNYYLIGEHLGHSFSPEIHRAFGRTDYGLKELTPAELSPFLKARAFLGLNVTVPYKQAVIPYLDSLDDRAAAIGAVNTVVNRNGALRGYNTDYGALLQALQRLMGGTLSGKTVLILGTGGTSKTAEAVCQALGAARIRRVSRTGREEALTYAEALSDWKAADLLLNTTPVGMYPDTEGLPIDPAAFPNLSGVFDCVYNPLRTRLVLEAERLGIPAAGGLEMLVRQAALAGGLFTGFPPVEAQIQAVCGGLRTQRESLVLIGMPGAGKTTLGRLLAKQTGREFADLDELLSRRAGMSIPEIFARLGETWFRNLETDLVRELSRTGGKILACGGGTVLRPENVLRLKQNGSLIFLDRPLEDLCPAPDRPLSDTQEKLRALYETRRPIYLSAADRTVPVTGTPAETAASILGNT